MDSRVEQFIKDVRVDRLRQTRLRVAHRVQALRQGRKMLKRQTADKMSVISSKLERVLIKFKELGYKIGEMAPSTVSSYFNFTGTHGINDIKGKCIIQIDDGHNIVNWNIGSTADPVIVLEAELVTKDSWSHPRVCRISYRRVMRTTNEILQVLLRGGSRY